LNGVRCILSGPAGGLVGAHFIAKNTAKEANAQVKIITLDMGGTSTDVSLIDDYPSVTTESMIGGTPIRVPVLDIHTIGAGGGSIAHVDAGGALRVGPQSAGADPGPACYGRGTLPTVTDANLLLGRLLPEYFLGGKMALSTECARRAIEPLAEQLNLSLTETALGIIAVVNANMERALRIISVERGYDPRDFTLLSFGGAGGLHCSNLARRIGAPRVCIPPIASTLSAFGMLVSDIVKDYTQTVMLPGDAPGELIAAALAPLVERGLYEIAAEGMAQKDIVIERLVDIRYLGQSYELSIPLSDHLHTDFDIHHQRTYGYCRPESPVEIVNLRVRATGKVSKPGIKPQYPVNTPGLDPINGIRNVFLSTTPTPLPLYQGEYLPPGSLFYGPALIAREDTTILIEAGDICQTDEYGNAWIDVRSSPSEL
jgi:N-methylhydantoinase A